MTGPAVAYLLKMFPRFSETFILDELLELERQGLQVEIYSLRPPADPNVHRDVARLGARVTYVPLPSRHTAAAFIGAHLRLAVRHPAPYVWQAWRALRRRRSGAWKRFLQAGWIAPRLEASGIGHVHAHFASLATSAALDLHRLVGTTYSFTAHAKDIYLDGVSRDDLARKLASARFAVTVSDYNLRYLAPLDGSGNLVRVYNGLDLSQFSFSLPGTDAAAGQPPLVLAVGRLIAKKGFADLVRACALLRAANVRFRCRIVGSGELREELERLVAELGLGDHIALHGPLPREELIELLPRASVFAAPCVVGPDGNRDGLPTVIIEAMARGVPVVATDVTGIPELVYHDRTGLIVPQHDPAALADALRGLLADSNRGQALAAAARQLVEERFDRRRNAAELRALFTDMALQP